MILKSTFIFGIKKDCDCKKTIKRVNKVRNVLLKDMFDMKVQNDMLSSRIDRLEQMVQEKFSVQFSFTNQGKTLKIPRSF